MAESYLLTWFPASPADVYHVYVQEASVGVWFTVGMTNATRYQAKAPASFERPIFGIAAVVAGIEADPDDWTLIPIAIHRPPQRAVLTDPSGFALGQDGGVIRAVWTPSSDSLVDHYVIRKGSVWETSRPVIEVPASAAPVASFGWETATGTQTYLLRAVGKNGERSAVVSASIDLVREPSWVEMGSVAEGTAFSGTKTDTEVVSSSLRPTALPSVYSDWTSVYSTYTTEWWWTVKNGGTYVTPAVDAGVVCDERLDVNLGTTMVNQNPDYSMMRFTVRPETDGSGNALTRGAKGVESRVNYDGSLRDGFSLLLEIRTTPDDPAGSPTWSSWKRWVPGAVYHYRGYQLRLTFTLDWPFLFPSVTTFTHKRYRENKKDEGAVTVAATGGTDITFGVPFTVAPKMSGNLISSANAYFVTFASITTTGAKAYLWKHDGVEQSAGTIHWSAKGV